MHALFYRLIAMSIYASVIGILILFFRKIFKKIPISYFNVLWIFVMVLLLIPIRFRSKLSIQNYIPIPKEVIGNLDLQEELIHFDEVPNYYKEKETSSIKPFNILFGIWMSVSLIMILKTFLIYFLEMKKYRIGTLPNKQVYEIFLLCKEKLHIKSDVIPLIQQKVKTPAIFGVISPKLLLTEEMQNLSKKELEYIFTHELIHVKKKDTLWYFVLNLLKCIYWFNPFILFLFEKIKEDLEYATDKMTVDLLDNYKDYCKLLLKVAQFDDFQVVNAAAMCRDKKSLERRIIMLKNKAIMTCGTTVLLILLAITTFFISATLATNKLEESYEKELLSENAETFRNPFSEKYQVSANFEKRIHPITQEEYLHDGVDYCAPLGTEVLAIGSGFVTDTGFSGEKGNYVVIEHDKFTSEYRHLSKIDVEVGEEVSMSDKLGEVGSTGKSTGAHLHLSLYNEDGEAVNPLELINN